MKAEDTFIMGMSMGGFGAIHTALAYPEVFCKAVGTHDMAFRSKYMYKAADWLFQ